MSEENQNQPNNQAPEQADPDYRETLLLYNEKNGAVEAVSELRQQNNHYKVTTTQPLSANKPAFYHLKDYNAAAAFIKGFKSVESNRPYQFLKVPADRASDVTQRLLRLADNPKDPEGLKALHDHAVSSYQLERVKFNPGDLRLQELGEMGIVVSPKELEAMKHGIPTTELHDVRLKIGDIPIAGQFALNPYRDSNGEVQIGLQSTLPRPEFEREEYRMMFSTSEKEQLLAGKTPDRLYELPNPHTGEKEWCFAALNPATNRLVTIPKKGCSRNPLFQWRTAERYAAERAGAGRPGPCRRMRHPQQRCHLFGKGRLRRSLERIQDDRLQIQPSLYLSSNRPSARRPPARGPAEPRGSGLLEGEGASHPGQERQDAELHSAYRSSFERRSL